MNKKQYTEICDWQNKIFTESTPLTCTLHLREEVDELIDSLSKDPIDATELADCFLLLFGVCNKLGLEYETITYLIDAKMRVNEKREWVQTDKGYMKHKPQGGGTE